MTEWGLFWKALSDDGLRERCRKFNSKLNHLVNSGHSVKEAINKINGDT